MKETQVMTRHKSLVPFKRDKIQRAIEQANADIEANEQLTQAQVVSIVNDITQYVENYQKEYIEVEEIQDLVEVGIDEAGKFKLAKKYILYRYGHGLVREANTTDASIMSLIRNQNKEIANENSNKNTKIAATQRDCIAGEVSKDITRRLLLPKFISNAHDSAAIHFHDADYFIQPIFNCCLINMGDMLDNGTVMNGKLIESPKSFQVACTVMTQIIACVASNQYGGQSVDLRHLGKYLRLTKEKIYRNIKKQSAGELSDATLNHMVTERVHDELKSGVQTIQYQINTLMTTNGQSPFVTLFLHLDPQDPFLEENAQIVEEVLRQRLQGIKNEAQVYITPAFPKLVYALDEHNNLTGGKYDYITRLAVECSSKRMYPDYISVKKMREHYEGNVFSPMGCRSFLSPWKNQEGNYQFEGRFNQGVVSLNLPQIGILAKGNMDAFWKLFDERLELCYHALMARHHELKNVKSDSSPVHWQHGAIARLNPGDSIEPYLYNGYSSLSLGYIGIYELTKLMTGESHTQPVGEDFSLKVMKHMEKIVEQWKNDTSIAFGLYGTPAESLCNRFASADKRLIEYLISSKQEKAEDFQVALGEDITGKGYYTNSYHVDVREKIGAFDKFNFESKFQTISLGGCISYVELPDMMQNLPALEELVRYIYNNIQYAEFNTKSDYCHQCEYTGSMELKEHLHWYCPNCGNMDRAKMNVTRRTCGYLGENYWNDGKTQEISRRYVHVDVSANCLTTSS